MYIFYATHAGVIFLTALWMSDPIRPSSFISHATKYAINTWNPQ